MIKARQRFAAPADGVFIRQHNRFQAVARRFGNGQQFSGAGKGVRHIAACGHPIGGGGLFQLAPAGDEAAAGGEPLLFGQHCIAGQHGEAHGVGVEQIARVVIEADIGGRIKGEATQLPRPLQRGEMTFGLHRVECFGRMA